MKVVFRAIGVLLIYFGILPFLALVVAYLSGFIIVGKDYSGEATVGIVTHHGFPVWFVGTAPGISIMSSWHLDRFAVNIGIWFLMLLTIGIVLHIRIRKKRSSNQASQRIAHPGGFANVEG